MKQTDPIIRLHIAAPPSVRAERLLEAGRGEKFSATQRIRRELGDLRENPRRKGLGFPVLAAKFPLSGTAIGSRVERPSASAKRCVNVVGLGLSG